MTQELFEFDVLIENFLTKKISTKEFETRYLDKYLRDEDPISEELYQPLEWLFSEVDAYVPLELYPLGEDDIDEAQLRKSAAEVLEQIRALK